MSHFARRSHAISLRRTVPASVLILLLALPALVSAQATRADYERATGLRAKLAPLALNVVDRGGWIGKTSRYWYRKSVAGGKRVLGRRRRDQGKGCRLRPREAGVGPGEASGEKVER